VKKIASQLPHLFRNIISVVGLSLIVLVSSAQAQQVSPTTKVNKTPQVKQKAFSTNNKQAGIQLKENSLNRSSKSMNLNPELFKRIESTDNNESGANLDYRVQRGCLRRSFNEENLPANLGLENREFNDFFKSQAKGFFDRMRGSCIPYALALGNRNRFES
jgi:hypothetical protein